MTPEERAAQAIPPTYPDWSYEDLLQHGAGAIQQAVEAEREACARLAAVMGMRHHTDASVYDTTERAESRLAARIIAAIQARTSKS